MASLYDSLITNEDLLKQKNLRHRKINFDYEYISGFPISDFNLVKSLNWNSVRFKNHWLGQFLIPKVYMYLV